MFHSNIDEEMNKLDYALEQGHITEQERDRIQDELMAIYNAKHGEREAEIEAIGHVF